jgi:hypothetical protein
MITPNYEAYTFENQWNLAIVHMNLWLRKMNGNYSENPPAVLINFIKKYCDRGIHGGIVGKLTPSNCYPTILLDGSHYVANINITEAGIRSWHIPHLNKLKDFIRANVNFKQAYYTSIEQETNAFFTVPEMQTDFERSLNNIIKSIK